MAASNRLSAREIAAGDAGRYWDGDGLHLRKASRERGKWVLRITIAGRRRYMGLGGYPDVSLREARRLAADARATLRAGLDPIRERERARRALVQDQHLLKDVAVAAFEARKSELKGDGKAGRWFSPLHLHVLPALGHIPVADINQNDVRTCLAPIWHTKADTARKALNRLHIVLEYGAALGLDVDLQACAKARALLGKPRHEVKHIPAMPWQDVPTFYRSLSDGTVTHLALRLLILTGARPGPLRHIREDQIEGGVWTIPADDMKGRRGATEEFRVPLSGEAMAVIAEARPLARDGYLFPSVRKGVISDATMARLMERRGMEERPHGFRTSLRTWMAEATDARHEVAEAMLAHKSGSKVVRAYRRTDYLDERRALLERWGQMMKGECDG